MAYHFRTWPILLFCLLWTFPCIGQTGRYDSFTAKDGLPSSYVYRTLEDDKGFLWVATNAGVARFDGKYFQVFTTNEGLPDNDVFLFVKETDGRMWVQCFNEIPAYFDEEQNRFVVPYLPPKKAFAMTNTLGVNLTPLPNGGVSYSNRDQCVVFKDGKVKNYGSIVDELFASNVIKEFGDGSILVTSGIPYSSYLNQYQLKICQIKGEKILDSIRLIQDMPPHIKHMPAGGGKAYDGSIYLGFRYFSNFYVYKDFKTYPISWKTNVLNIPEPYINYYLTPDRLAFVTESGNIYIYSRQTLQFIHMIHNDYLTNSYFNDRKGNEWVSTIDKGVVAYRKRPLQTLAMPPGFINTGFLSISRKRDGTLLAGNFYGEVVEIKSGNSVVHQIIKKTPARIRKILTVGDDVYTFSEEGIYRNFKERILEQSRASLSFGKVAIPYNDSVILVGTHRNLLVLNTRTNKMQELYLTMKRTTALAKAAGDVVYFGSTNGLYKFDYKTKACVSMAAINPKLKERIAALCYTADGLLWVSTFDNRILVLKDDKIVKDLVINKELASSYKDITAGKPGQVWIATSNGVIVIRYAWNQGKFAYTTRTISAGDGLASNEVQELFYDNGLVYAATSNGISVIPESYKALTTNIPTYLVRMRINQKDALISDNYELDYGQQLIQMQFAGVDLNGYFKHLQYKLNDNEKWINLDQNTLTVQLTTGEHLLKVRAVDRNGHISDKILLLRFAIAIPFWQNVWFWIVGGILLQIALFYIISRYQKRKKEAKLAHKLAEVQTAATEQQAFTSLMNPHFIFNALNSIQHYINMQDRKNANRYLTDFASLIRKNFDAAHQSFIPLEEEIENIKIYLNLELMRFNDRFKFEVQVDNGLEVEDWMIPTMMLQPLLENALLHGLMPSLLPGELVVQIKSQGEDLLIVIMDNGIGLANSLALQGHGTHKSRGTELIRKRIKALSHFGANPMVISMEPAFDSLSNPGNKVTLLIPGTLYKAWWGNKHQ